MDGSGRIAADNLQYNVRLFHHNIHISNSISCWGISVHLSHTFGILDYKG
jgi:hypothetical protein